MKVLWITNIPSPYRLKFFSELGKSVELTVLFEKGYSAERDRSWKDFEFLNYRGVILPGVSVVTDMAMSFGYQKYIREHKDGIIVVSNPITPTGISAILYMQFHNIRYCVESDGAFPKENSGLKGMLKTRLYSHAEVCLTTSELGKQYFVNYGVKESCIEKYPFSSVYLSEISDRILTHEERKGIRSSLNIEGEYMILSVGRFLPWKGFDNLIKAFNQTHGDCVLCIVGGTPTQEYYTLVSETKVSRTKFLDFMTPNELRKYYDAADLFAFASHDDIWGLVVNEAMSRGLPVVSSDHVNSALEMVKEGKNGYIFRDDDIDSLVAKIETVLYSNDYTQLCRGSLHTAREYTIETMVECHISLFEKLCKTREKREGIVG